MKNKGRGSGLALILILIVALVIAYLAVTNLSFLGAGGSSTQEEVIQEDPVDRAQDAVDQINQRIQETTQEP